MLLTARRFTHLPTFVPGLVAGIHTWLKTWRWLLIPGFALVAMYAPTDAHGQSPSSPSAATSFVL
jgi:hypothetical protein